MTSQSPLPPAAPQPRDTQVMLFAVISSIVVALAIIGIVVVVAINGLGGEGQINADSPTGPFNTLARPSPTVFTVYELLPSLVGDFTLVAVTGSLESGYVARYENGNTGQIINISGREAVNDPAAQYSVQLIQEERGVASEGERIMAGEFSKSYYLDAKPNDVRFAWSREQWFFDITTDSLATLSAFMPSFPY